MHFLQKLRDSLKLSLSHVSRNFSPRLGHFISDYFGVLVNQTLYSPSLQGLKTDMRDLVVNAKGIFLLGRSKIDKKTGAGGEPVIARHIPFEELALISLSTRQDDLVVLHVSGSYDSLLQVPFKTEMVSVIKKVAGAKGKEPRIAFADK